MGSWKPTELKSLMINHYDFQRKSSLIINHQKSNTAKNTRRNRHGYSAELAQSKARYISDKLKNPSINFYLKCAWNLTDMYLDNLLQIALTKSEPAKYFSKAAAREMRLNGV